MSGEAPEHGRWSDSLLTNSRRQPRASLHAATEAHLLESFLSDFVSKRLPSSHTV